MQRIMIIRHAEKHAGTHERGVNLKGYHTSHELTVRGWIRSGALVRFFAPIGGTPQGWPISTPRSIFASAATEESPSLRAQHTVRPLADVLGVPIDSRFPDGDEPAVVAAVLAAPPPVLIAWHHSHIPKIVRMIGGQALDCPAEWPDDRFDIVWILDRPDAGSAWRFSQVAQGLFAYDRPEPI